MPARRGLGAAGGPGPHIQPPAGTFPHQLNGVAHLQLQENTRPMGLDRAL
jgi:hypothetical protein